MAHSAPVPPANDHTSVLRFNGRCYRMHYGFNLILSVLSNHVIQTTENHWVGSR